MLTPPSTITLAPVHIYDGQPAEGDHARMLDRYATWIATAHRSQPVHIGHHIRSGTVHTHLSRVPQLTAEVHAQYLCSGRGSIETIWDGDSDVLTVTAGSGQSGTHSLADATWWTHAAPWALTVIATTDSVVWSYEVDDLGGGVTLRVYAVRLVFVPPAPGVALP